jgi:hypothetical protein
MPADHIRKVCAGAVLVAGIAGCSHGDPVSARISGKVEMSGGRYPGIHSPPQRADVLVTGAARATVRRESVSTGLFAFTLPKGGYQVSVRAGGLPCGRPQDVAVRSSESIALSFICQIP